MDFSALRTDIAAGVTTIYNLSLYFSLILCPGLLGFENEKTLEMSLQIFRQMVSIRHLAIQIWQLQGILKEKRLTSG